MPKTKGRRAATKPRRTAGERAGGKHPTPAWWQRPIMVEARIARQDLEAASVRFAGDQQSTAVPIPIAQTMTVRRPRSTAALTIELSRRNPNGWMAHSVFSTTN